MRKATRNFEKSIARSSKMNPKLFWAHVRRRMKTKAGVAPLLESKEDKTSLKFGDKEKASILQDQFSSVFTKEPTGDVPTLGKLTNALIRSIEITAEMVEKELKNIKTNKSPGPDGIHPLMLKELAAHLSLPLAFLFNVTLNTGDIPDDWRRARVSPIFKKGSRSHAENYRSQLVSRPSCVSLWKSSLKKQFWNIF